MKKYGLNDRFYSLSTVYEGLTVGRVILQEKGSYKIVIESGELSEERLITYNKLRSELAYAEDSESYLATKQRRFKKIEKYNKANKNR